jgi:hypothetical protein
VVRAFLAWEIQRIADLPMRTVDRTCSPSITLLRPRCYPPVPLLSSPRRHVTCGSGLPWIQADCAPRHSRSGVSTSYLSTGRNWRRNMSIALSAVSTKGAFPGRTHRRNSTLAQPAEVSYWPIAHTTPMRRTSLPFQDAPGALGPYSQAIKASPFVFLSGNIPAIPSSGNIVEGGIEAQTVNSSPAILVSLTWRSYCTKQLCTLTSEYYRNKYLLIWTLC